MYGFGDVANPAADSISVLDDLVIDYITDMVTCLRVLFKNESMIFTFPSSVTKLQVLEKTEERFGSRISSLYYERTRKSWLVWKNCYI